MKRIEDAQQAYCAALEALDLIKAIQAASLRCDLKIPATAISDARAAVDSLAQKFEGTRKAG